MFEWNGGRDNFFGGDVEVEQRGDAPPHSTHHLSSDKDFKDIAIQNIIVKCILFHGLCGFGTIRFGVEFE